MEIASSGKIMQYMFLAFFLMVFVGVIILSIRRNKAAANRSSPTRRDSRDVPLYEKIAAIVLVAMLPCGVIAFIVFENMVVGGVCIGIFVLVILTFALLGGVNKVAITTHVYGSTTTVYYTTKEFEARLLEGTLDLTNCRVKFPKGYKPPKANAFTSPENDDPFAKYD